MKNPIMGLAALFLIPIHAEAFDAPIPDGCYVSYDPGWRGNANGRTTAIDGETR